MGEMVTISYEEYIRLQKAEDTLNALYGAGVDNWEGYDFAMEMLENEDE